MHSRSLKWRMIGVAVATALASCAVGPDFHQPKPPDASDYLHPSSDAAPVKTQAQDVQNISQGAELAGEWWQLFHSPQLDEMVRISIAASPTLVAARATLAEAPGFYPA
jgi:outer membrane protein TolC